MNYGCVVISFISWQAIDNLRSPPRLIEKPFRMSISDIFKPTSGGAGGFCAAGRIETGYIQKSDTVLIAPLNEYATVKVSTLLLLKCRLSPIKLPNQTKWNFQIYSWFFTERIFRQCITKLNKSGLKLRVRWWPCVLNFSRDRKWFLDTWPCKSCAWHDCMWS